jgi:hypothetical protein
MKYVYLLAGFILGAMVIIFDTERNKKSHDTKYTEAIISGNDTIMLTSCNMDVSKAHGTFGWNDTVNHIFYTEFNNFGTLEKKLMMIPDYMGYDSLIDLAIKRGWPESAIKRPINHDTVYLTKHYNHVNTVNIGPNN